jgi:hypothetical protein
MLATQILVLGNPLTDLRKEDFELLEDGVRQEIAGLHGGYRVQAK